MSRNPASRAQFFRGPLGRLGELEAFASSGGDLVFTSGMTGHDLTTGRLVREEAELPGDLRRAADSGMVIADLPETRIRAQTLLALDHVRRALEEAGSSLAQLVRLRLFLRDVRDCGSAAAVVQGVLGARTPATTIIEATAAGTHPDIDVVIDAVGARETGAFKPQHIFVPRLEKLLRGFPAATVAGPYVFTTPLSAADPESGRMRTSPSALSPDEESLLDRSYFNPREEALAVEQVLMWRNIRHILEAAGVLFENILHQNNWLALTMQQYVPVTKVRGRLFGRGEARTAATSLPVSNLSTPEAAFECSLIGLKSDRTPAGARKEIRLESHGVGPYYVGAVKAGPYVFAAGEVPVRAMADQKPRLIRRAEDLDEDLRLVNFGRVHAEYPLMAQAHCVYELISEALARYGCGMADVLQQTVYLVQPAHFPALERIATLHYGPRLPPTTLVPIRGASPFRETLLEIEVTALTASAS